MRRACEGRSRASGNIVYMKKAFRENRENYLVGRDYNNDRAWNDMHKSMEGDIDRKDESSMDTREFIMTNIEGEVTIYW